MVSTGQDFGYNLSLLFWVLQCCDQGFEQYQKSPISAWVYLSNVNLIILQYHGILSVGFTLLIMLFFTTHEQIFFECCNSSDSFFTVKFSSNYAHHLHTLACARRSYCNNIWPIWHTVYACVFTLVLVMARISYILINFSSTSIQ